MTLGCQHSPSVSGGVAQQGSRENSHECESQMGVASVVVNMSCEWESQVESQNVSREWESRNVSHKWELQVESQNGVPCRLWD